MTEKIRWRMGDNELPDTCADFDKLLALRFQDGVGDDELALIESMFVNLHGSSAWGRLRERLKWGNLGEGGRWYYDEYFDSARWVTVSEVTIYNASSVWVDPD